MIEIAQTFDKALETLLATTDDLKKSCDARNEMMTIQTQMFDIAVALLISLHGEESTPFQIKRRIIFALKQIKGLSEQITKTL